MTSHTVQDRISLAVDRGIIYLRQTQKANGQFVGLASPHINDFSGANIHQTTFFTSLIVASLESVFDTHDIKSKAANFILKERSATWSWNYWLRDCDDYNLRPYPDDLDDTACALIALAIAKRESLTQDCLANFAKHLISQESKPGGPYSTWLVDSTAKSVWKDFDIAVNANIGNFLSYQAIKLDDLEDFVTEIVLSDSLISKYYLGEVPVIYFLARWYKGPAAEVMCQKVESLLMKHSELNDLHLSMLLTSAINLNSSLSLELMVLDLLSRQSDDSWAASALYYEPAVNGVKYYAGSPGLTTAMACEALQKYIDFNLKNKQAKLSKQDSISLSISSNKRVVNDIETRYVEYLESIIKRDSKGQITQIATLTAQSLDQAVDHTTLADLNQASLNGWASYTLFDDFIDDDGKTDQLPMAMLGLRRAGSYFRKALPGNQKFADYVEAMLDIVDTANDWESTNCRLPFNMRVIGISDLPNFTDLNQLADKSWGHTIASSGVLLRAGFPLNSSTQLALQKFYSHYLIARQLNDDAHDWQTDLANRQLSFVVSDLISSYLKYSNCDFIRLDSQIVELQTFFWEHTILKVIDLINSHLKLARETLNDCKAIKNKSIFSEWLDDIQVATDKAADSRKEAQEFINSFR